MNLLQLNKILIVGPQSHLSSMNFIDSTVKYLLRKGHEVVILTSDKNFNAIWHGKKKVSVITICFNNRNYDLIIMNNFRLFKALYSVIKSYDIQYILAVGQIGLIASGFISLLYSKKLVYISDEVWFGKENGTWWLTKSYSIMLKQLERLFNSRAIYSIIQDTGRAKLLSEVNRIDYSSIKILPNSPFGKAVYRRRLFLHEQFNLNKSVKIVLWIGMLPRYSEAESLVLQANSWPDSLVLFFHTRYDAEGDNYVDELKRIGDPRKVFFSLKPVPYSSVMDIVSSAHIGLALYKNTGLNASKVGKSSGKIAMFLKCGIPVVCQNFDSTAWIHESNAGVLVNKIQEVDKAITLIDDDYNNKTLNAINSYNRYLETSKYLENCFSKISNN